MNRLTPNHSTFRTIVLTVAAGLACTGAVAQEVQPPVDEVREISTGQLLEMLQRQDAELNSQRELIAKQQAALDTQTAALHALQTRVDTLPSGTDRELSEEEQSIRARLESLEGTVAEMPDAATTTTYDATEFSGAFPLPGTSAALRIGGFVKMNIVQSFSALGSQDRFIVGTIPTDGITDGDAESALTVQQSRLNLELRQATDQGQLRAFVEGDFAGTGETFRLRHAFGQFQDLLAGKTWTTFMDVESSPEELDFEGINGRINVRQPQLRFFPQIGREWNLAVSLEDPRPSVTGGDGVSQFPDVVASIRRTWFDRWHVKSSLILRNLRARQETNIRNKQNEFGWGLSLSGRVPAPWWEQRDNILFQLNLGEGYGRYVNDLGTIGGQDAVFNQATGELVPLPVQAGYLSFQHWWRDGLRSNFVASFVNVDNESFQLPGSYHRTERYSVNVIWSPIRRVDVGGELLWGRREDKDGADGEAAQFQGSFRFRFQ